MQTIAIDCEVSDIWRHLVKSYFRDSTSNMPSQTKRRSLLTKSKRYKTKTINNNNNNKTT